MLTAAKIVGRVGDIHRFRSAAAFAAYTGTAPIEVSSGEVTPIDFPAPAIDNSTHACTSWPSPKSVPTPKDGPTTGANEQKAKAKRKPYAASNADSPTRSTDKCCATNKGQAREDTRGRPYALARPAHTPHTGTSDQSLPEPAPKPYNPS